MLRPTEPTNPNTGLTKTEPPERYPTKRERKGKEHKWMRIDAQKQITSNPTNASKSRDNVPMKKFFFLSFFLFFFFETLHCFNYNN